MSVREKICAATFFVCMMAHVILGYVIQLTTGTNIGYRYGFLFYILVILMPFLTGVIKIHIYYETVVVLLYFTVCIVTQMVTKGTAHPLSLWHPGWVIFLTIPIYHIFRDIPAKKEKKTTAKDGNKNIDVDIIG